jgi:hypothetical protein
MVRDPFKTSGDPGRSKRAVKRCNVVASAEVVELGSDAKLSVRISELGLGGCYVDTLNPFPEGSLVRLKITRDDATFQTKARVAYAQSSFGMGIAFTEMSPDDKAILQKWIAELIKK